MIPLKSKLSLEMICAFSFKFTIPGPVIVFVISSPFSRKRFFPSARIIVPLAMVLHVKYRL